MRKLIAICGQPGHGKSTVQTILQECFGVLPFDDGLPIREEVLKRYPFLTWDDVTTIAGKNKVVQANGESFTVRQLLGNLGKEYEDSEPGYWARIAIERALVEDTIVPASFGSVRRTQPSIYREHGGLVVEVCDPRKGVSPNDFDQYDRSAVHLTILNDGSLDELYYKTICAVSPYLYKEDA